MNRLESIYDLTKQLDSLLDQEIPQEQRADVIEKINQLTEERGRQMVRLEPPFSMDEKQTGEKLIPLDTQINARLEEIFTNLKGEMRTVKKQKTSNSKYVNPYQNLSSLDGMFLDHKK